MRSRRLGGPAYDAAYLAVETAKQLAQLKRDAAIASAYDDYRESCGDADVEFAAAINAVRASQVQA